MSKNLSEVLFSQKSNAKETSTLIANSGSKKHQRLHQSMLDGQQNVGWYRLLKLLQWSWQGIDIIDCYEVLAKISASSNKRSDPNLLDTVIGFRSGNWSYEWSKKAMSYQKKANHFMQAGKQQQAKHHYYLASQLYSVASYPHLKGDEHSIQAQTLAVSNYRQSFTHDKSALLKEIQIPFEGKHITTFLHLPNDDVIHPVVIVSAGIDSLQCDLLPLFENYLKPAGIAMLTVDMPGVGFSNHLKLTQDTSQLHQAVLHYINEIPWVDQSRVALMGMRMGGNALNRLGYVDPQRIKAVVSVGAAVASIFDDVQRFEKLSVMTLDCLASRMQLQQSDASYLYQYCVPFSLVKQGLLGRKKVKTPYLSIGHSDDLMCSEQDLKLMARISYESEAKIIDKSPIFDSYLRTLGYSAQWLAKHLQE
ncbi:esterase FrsA [Psychromonas sp. 14N.309.X.WAT.B.A12]|uniref:esterase FrsA n=1 Tax=unclassified Psychromonas TaxID=2614957 RepID=UPI0025B1E5AB|nr:esterase FrsA [Psychromonas sp. 14N.309.X.WAT.B.A12]MDN2662910.1 esterase FrsA [Psychromonas sp. 14N.309.X.WAT.B.A12]